MNKLVYPLACLAVLLANMARGDDLPFFSPLREEVANQLTVASNTVPLDKKLLASLRSNLKSIDKTKPTLTAGSTPNSVRLGFGGPSSFFLRAAADDPTRQTHSSVSAASQRATDDEQRT